MGLNNISGCLSRFVKAASFSKLDFDDKGELIDLDQPRESQDPQKKAKLKALFKEIVESAVQLFSESQNRFNAEHIDFRVLDQEACTLDKLRTLLKQFNRIENQEKFFVFHYGNFSQQVDALNTRFKTLTEIVQKHLEMYVKHAMKRDVETQNLTDLISLKDRISPFFKTAWGTLEPSVQATIEIYDSFLRRKETLERLRSYNPDLSKTFEALSDEDQEWFFQMQETVSDDLLTIYIANIEQINKFESVELRTLLKNYFAFEKSKLPWSFFGDLGQLDKGSFLATFLKDYQKLLSLPRASAIEWLFAIEINVKDLPPAKRLAKTQAFWQSLMAFCNKFQRFPYFHTHVGLEDWLTIVQQAPENYDRGHIADDFPHKIHLAKRDQDLERILQTFKSWTYRTLIKELSIEQFCKLRPYFEKLSKIEQSQVDDILWEAGHLMEKLPPLLREGGIKLLLMFPDNQSLIPELRTYLTNHDSPDALRDFFVSKGELKLYQNLFAPTTTPEFWNNFQAFLDEHSEQAPFFYEWIARLSFLPTVDKTTWVEKAKQFHPNFLHLLNQMYAMGQQSPELFGEMIKLMNVISSQRALTILLAHYRNFGAQKTIPFIRFLIDRPGLCDVLPEEMKNIDFSTEWVGLDSEKLTFCISSNCFPFKFADMLSTYRKDPSKFNRLIALDMEETIWFPGDTNSYSTCDIKSLDLKQKHRDHFENSTFKHWFPWNQIPDPMWKIDPRLPLRLFERFMSVGLRKVDMKPLLQAIVESPDTPHFAKRLLEVFEGGTKDEGLCRVLWKKELKTLLKIFNRNGEAHALTVLSALSSQSHQTLSFLTDPPWTGSFSRLINRLTELFALDHRSDSMQEKIRHLPESWKMVVIRLIDLGLCHPDILEVVCAFLEQHPHISLLESLLVIIKKIEPSKLQEWLALFTKYPHWIGALHELKKHEPSMFSNALQVFGEVTDHSFLDFILRLPKMKANACRVYLSAGKVYEQLLLRLYHLDQRLGNGQGKFIGVSISESLVTLLETNPEMQKAIQAVGLRGFVRESYELSPSLYLDYFTYRPYEIATDTLFSPPNKKLLDLLAQLDRQHISKEHVLALVNLEQMEALSLILQMIVDTGDYELGSALMDMSMAGYIPEASELARRRQQQTSNALNRLLFEKAGSIHAPNIQRILSSSLTLEEALHLFSTSPSPSATCADLETTEDILGIISKAVQPLMQETFKTIYEKNRAIETAFSIYLGQYLIDPKGHLNRTLLAQVSKALPNCTLFPPDSDFAIYLSTTLKALETCSEVDDILSRTELSKDLTSPSHQIIRKMMNVPAEEPLNKRHAQVSLLSAIFSRPRQSDNIGSCYGTQLTIISQSDSQSIVDTMEDYRIILAENHLVRGKSEKTEFSLVVPSRKIKEKIMTENLLLKARENLLSNMAGTSPIGIMEATHKLFEPDQFFGKSLGAILSDRFAVAAPIPSTDFLQQLQHAFDQLVYPVVNFDQPNPITNELGNWILERRDRIETIDNPNKYFHSLEDALSLAMDEIQKAHPKWNSHLLMIRESWLKQIIVNFKLDYSSKLLDLARKKDSSTNPADLLLYMRASGGLSQTVLATYLQFKKDMPLQGIKPGQPEVFCQDLLNFLQALPSKEKAAILAEPEKLLPFRITGHAMCLKPYPLLHMLDQGTSSDQILQRLKAPVTISFKDVTEEQRDHMLKQWIQAMPTHCRTAFQQEWKQIDWSQMTVDACGQALFNTFKAVYGMQPPNDVIADLENAFFTSLPKELQKQIPYIIFGDYNHDGEDFNNVYLSLGKNLLTGEVDYFETSRKGDQRSLMVEYKNHTCWFLFHPLSRKVNGCLSID